MLLACASLPAARLYPSRPARIIVPFAPAGGTDILSRTLAQKMTESVGQPFIVDNRALAEGHRQRADPRRISLSLQYFAQDRLPGTSLQTTRFS